MSKENNLIRIYIDDYEDRQKIASILSKNRYWIKQDYVHNGGEFHYIEIKIPRVEK
jgi:hypothetical protein